MLSPYGHRVLTFLTPRAALAALAAYAACAALPAALLAQEPATITGRVTNETGAPLTSATVSIPALGLGAMTREDGQYSFVVPAARVTSQPVTLQARRVGYTPATATLVLHAGANTQDFRMTQSALRLSEVVVTGAGTSQIRERLGNVINTVDSSTLQRATEPLNVVSALAGKAPNVVVRTQSGEPGSSASILIRGASSVMGTNQPLFVVDNMPIDNSTISDQTTPYPGTGGTVAQNRAADINPNDIESVQILKGAAASAIYGARAANGVVLITTKRGTSGPTRYTLSSTATWDHVIKTMPLQRQYGIGFNGVSGMCNTTNCRTSDAPGTGGFGFLTWGPSLGGSTATFDHAKEIYRTGSMYDNNLTISGGNQRTTFFISGGVADQLGVAKGPNNRYDRSSIRLKAAHQLLTALNIGGNFSYVDSRGEYVQKGSNTSGLLLGALRTPPDFNNLPYLDPNSGLHRSFRLPQPGATSTTTSRGYDNPFFILNNPGNRSELGRFIGNVNADYVPTDWLAIHYTLGADSYSDGRRQSDPLTSSDQPTGKVIRSTINVLQLDHNLLATLSHSFRTNVDTRLTVGQNLNSRRYRDVWVTGLNLIAPEPLALQNTVTWTPFEQRSLVHIEGYFAQAEADLYNQLYLTLGVRNDGFSTFGASQKRANYPKASIAWTFTNALSALTDRGWLSQGKLRASYGETGREPPVYATLTALSSTTLLGSGFGDVLNPSQSGQGGLVTSYTLGNSNLKPERDRETELGADLGFFNQRGNLGITFYNKRSTDVILSIPTQAASTGTLNKLANAASIQNRGVELELGIHPLNTPRYGWDINVNYGRNRGKVLSLAEGVQFVPYNNEGFTGSIGSATVGYAPGVLRGNNFLLCGYGKRVDIAGNGTIVDVDAACGAGAKKGSLYLGSDGYPVVDPDEGVISDPNPRWMGGINTSVRFGNFQVSGFLDVRKGGQVWNGTRAALYRFGTHRDTDIRSQTGVYFKDFYKDVYKGFAGPGVNVVAFNSMDDWQNWFTGEGGNASDAQAQFVEDGSFTKLRELSVAYRLEQRSIVSRLGISSADIRLAGRNLYTWTKYRGLDPEVNLGGAEWLTQGVDYFNSPLTRSFVLSVTLNR